MTGALRARRVAVFIALFLALTVIVIAAAVHFGGEWLRAEFERRLQNRIVPAVRVDGPVRVRLRPAPTLVVNGIRIGGDGEADMLEIRSLAVELDPAQLLHGRVALSALTLEGGDIALRRGDEGDWNFAGLLRPDPAVPSNDGAIAIGRVVVANTALRLVGAHGEPLAELSELRLTSGPFGPGMSGTFELNGRVTVDAAFPADLRIASSGNYRFDEGTAIAENLAFNVQGIAAQWRIDRGEAHVARLRRERDGTVRLGDSRLALELAEGESALAVQGSLAALETVPVGGTAASGTGGTAIGANFEGGTLELPHPAGEPAPLNVSFSGDLRFDPAGPSVRGTVAGSFDDSRFDGRWRFEPEAVPPLGVALSLDRLDLDRYLPPPAAKPAPADLTAWRNWPVEADLRVGRLTVGGFVSENARLRLGGGPVAANSATGAR
ncbi:AsmA family protein [Aromatoleum buckelii]|uniref:AsmA domain-containing protein n=1 Tax=Aromatoleum buckelii TaxID=200254 RepID=A0ABX1MZC1_9RHOO|nr:hypothetical protein [Aromatoleum buckelii]MCK0510231.1 hypothetical protein [Aromatoleum buckelii]